MVEPTASSTNADGDRATRPHRAGAVVGGARWLAVSQVVTQASRILVSVVLAALLPPAAFGVVALATTLILFCDVFKDFGTGTAVIQRREVTPALLTSVLWLNVVVGGVLTGALAIAAPLLADLLDDPSATDVIRVFSVVLVLTSAGQVHHALLRRELRFKAVAMINLAGAVANGVVAISLAALGAGVWALVVGGLTQTAIAVGLAWRWSGWRPRGRPRTEPLRTVAGFSSGVAAFNVCNFALVHSDKLLVGSVLGPTSLGVYAVAQRLLMYPVQSIAQVVQEVLFPAFARLQDDDAALRRGYLRATGGIALVAAPVMTGAALVSGPFVATALGPEWRDLVPLAWVLAPVGAVQSTIFCLGTIFTAKGRADALLRWGLWTGGLTCAAYAVGVQFGLLQMAFAYAVAVLVLVGPTLRRTLGLIELPVGQFLRNLLPSVLATLVMTVAVLLTAWVCRALDVAPLLDLVARCLVGAGVYGAAILVLAPPAVADLVQVVRLRRRGEASTSGSGEQDAVVH